MRWPFNGAVCRICWEHSEGIYFQVASFSDSSATATSDDCTVVPWFIIRCGGHVKKKKKKKRRRSRRSRRGRRGRRGGTQEFDTSNLLRFHYTWSTSLCDGDISISSAECLSLENGEHCGYRQSVHRAKWGEKGSGQLRCFYLFIIYIFFLYLYPVIRSTVGIFSQFTRRNPFVF